MAQEIIHLLDPAGISSPFVVICWEESHSLVEPVSNYQWTLFSELQYALRTIREVPFISVFVSTAPKFHLNHPTILESANCQFKMFPPITEFGFDQFAENVDCIKEEWSLARIASTHQMVHLGRAL